MSDTAASEVGKAYGKTAYLVTTLAVVPRGTEGAVSVEGTVAGVVASLAMGALAVGMRLIAPAGLPVVAVAALVATTAESVIGATVQEQVRGRCVSRSLGGDLWGVEGLRCANRPCWWCRVSAWRRRGQGELVASSVGACV